ncbi:MAG TPA: 4-alpha-glucanotransferase [Rudaea sp.]|nr:4-alpha-glucanotransferase [Rudaea sp.]
MPTRDRELEAMAAKAGLLVDWQDAFGRRRRVSPETLRALLDSIAVDPAEARMNSEAVPALVTADAAKPVLDLPLRLARKARRARIALEFGGMRECPAAIDARGQVRLGIALPPGYHRLELGGAQLQLAAAPARCFTIADATAETRPRAFGIAAQIYSLRREGELGCGDFGALAEFASAAAERGAAALAISPVHAMFAADPDKYSPYSPSNRCFLNTLYADPACLAGGAEIARIVRAGGFAGEAAALARARYIDWPRTAALRRHVFERLFARFLAGDFAGAADFALFRRDGGNALAHHACFEALQETLAASRASARMTSRFADASAPGALAFARANAERIGFHAFMQWCAARGLASAQAAARARGMPIGLIADLAVGVDPAGSECWSTRHDMLARVSIGAPPDALNAVGQNWGLTTFSPIPLVHNGYAPFLSMLRAAMRHAGGVRLDHVMSLTRLWLIPSGARPTEGGYLRFPTDALLRLVALESWRHRAIVIGEDLGTVPAECRERLARAGILGLDVLAFMRNARGFLPPRRWRRDAVAMTSTHDIAPVAGWWRARDLDWRRRLRLFGEIGEADERAARVSAREELAQSWADSASTRVSARSPLPRVVDAAIHAVGITPAPLAVLPVEDLVGAVEQPNLPGTIAEHPNWRRRYRAGAQVLLSAPRVAARIRRLARARRRSS